MTLDPPVFVIVSDNPWLFPTVTLPKLSAAGLDESVPCETPVPDNVTDKEGFEAFEVTVNAPVALPADWGAKVTVKVAVWEGLSVTGVVIPLTVNPVPLTAT